MSRRSKRNVVRPGYLGPAFHEWLSHLEFCESLVLRGRVTGRDRKRYANGAVYSFNDKMWLTTAESHAKTFRFETKQGDMLTMSETVHAMLPIDAYLAHLVRSSVKYKMSFGTVLDILDRYGPEVDEIIQTTPVYLPFDPVTIVFTDLNLGMPDKTDDVVVNLFETTAGERDRYGKLVGDSEYKELGLEKGEKFLSVSMALFRHEGVEMLDGTIDKNQRISHVPVEIHSTLGKPWAHSKRITATAAGIGVTKVGDDVLTRVKMLIMYWLASFELQSMKRRRKEGHTPSMLVEAARKRKKPKHRSKFEKPMFEHFVVEMEVDAPAPGQTDITREKHKKRLHEVRKHKRTYKSGKVVWVKSHWRGDKELGVVKKDFEVTVHENREEEHARHTDH